MTNSGILCFTLNAFNLSSTSARVWAFYIFQFCLFSLIFVVQLVIEDVPTGRFVGQTNRGAHHIYCTNVDTHHRLGPEQT